MESNYILYAIWIGIGTCLLYAAVILSNKKRFSIVYDRFQVNPMKYRIVGVDIGKHKKPFFVSKQVKDVKINGTPDAVFAPWPHLFFLSWIIGEYKSRHLKEGPSRYELLQLTAYMHCLSTNNVQGLLLYGDQSLVQVGYSKKLGRELFRLTQPAFQAKQRKKTSHSGLKFDRASVASLVGAQKYKHD